MNMIFTLVLSKVITEKHCTRIITEVLDDDAKRILWPAFICCLANVIKTRKVLVVELTYSFFLRITNFEIIKQLYTKLAL